MAAIFTLVGFFWVFSIFVDVFLSSPGEQQLVTHSGTRILIYVENCMKQEDFFTFFDINLLG